MEPPNGMSRKVSVDHRVPIHAPQAAVWPDCPYCEPFRFYEGMFLLCVIEQLWGWNMAVLDLEWLADAVIH